MSTIAGAANAVRMLKDNFWPDVTNSLRDSEGLIHDLITDQLMSGLDENKRPLKPTYLDDPYFVETTKTPEAAKKKAHNYKAYKERITPPDASDILHLPPRDSNTPNLIIRGDYHASILPVVQAGKDGGKIVTKSVGFYAGDDLEKKYGPGHLGLTPEAKAYLLDERVMPAIKKLFEKYGFK